MTVEDTSTVEPHQRRAPTASKKGFQQNNIGSSCTPNEVTKQAFSFQRAMATTVARATRSRGDTV